MTNAECVVPEISIPPYQVFPIPMEILIELLSFLSWNFVLLNPHPSPGNSNAFGVGREYFFKLHNANNSLQLADLVVPEKYPYHSHGEFLI